MSKFHLRIRPKDIIQNYLNGQYNNMKLLKTTQEESPNYNVVSKFGNSPYDERYIIMGRSNNPITIVTTNHTQFTQNFVGVPESSVSFKKPIQDAKKRCGFCHREFTHDHVGIPIRMENSAKNIIFHCKGIFHSFSCAYAYLIKEPRSRAINTIDIHYSDSESLLKLMFNLIHPDKQLVPAKDSELLDINGGPLSVTEYDNEHLQYRQLNNVISTNVKLEYVQYLNKQI